MKKILASALIVLGIAGAIKFVRSETFRKIFQGAEIITH